MSYPRVILKVSYYIREEMKHTLAQTDHDAVCASLGYAARDEMTRILRHRAEGVKGLTAIRKNM